MMDDEDLINNHAKTINHLRRRSAKTKTYIDFYVQRAKQGKLL